MLEIWDESPPAFVTLAAAHLSKKKKRRKSTPQKESETSTTPAADKEYGTMADLAAQFGIGGSVKKATI